MISFLKKNFWPLSAFVIWLTAYRGFYPGHLIMGSGDAKRNAMYINYYLNNIWRGVYPMWNPFNVWGRPDFYSPRMIGEFNPFFHLIYILEKIGFSFGVAYYIFSAFYYVLGMLGLYLLAKRVLNDRAGAYLALLLLLFSTLSFELFNNGVMVSVLFPTIWFFYFLVAFTQTPHRVFLLGLTFTAMLIAVTYLPFYFLTVFLSFLLGFTALYGRLLPSILMSYWKFIKDNKLLVAFCLLSALYAMGPGFFWLTGSSEYFVNWRHATSGSQAAAIPYKVTTAGGYLSYFHWQQLFSDLKSTGLGHIYIPIFAYIILFLSLIVALNRRMVLLFSLSFFIFLISLGDTTPVHKFLYDHAAILKYFRNLHFLVWFFIPPLLIFLGETFKNFSQPQPLNTKQKILTVFYIIITHMTLFLAFYHLGKIILSTYLTVLLSAAFFCFYVLSRFKNKEALLLPFLCAVVLLQPLEVFHYLKKNMYHTFPYLDKPYTQAESIPRFSFTRPVKGEDTVLGEVQEWAGIEDASGFLDGNYTGSVWSYKLHQEANHDTLKNYVKNKFYLYDDTKAAENRAVDYQGEAIAGNSDTFQVLSFDLNHIKLKTNFPKDKFLVYSDSYNSQWQAFINGAKAPLYRANIAFKGVWVPGGEHIVLLRYRPLWQHIFYHFLVIFFGLFLILIIAESYRYAVKKTR
ncbi:MAG: hypothetical protein A2Z88_00705 [Omnitrophica WOR_2 bacterium GWA2_47_8]|nr:MAG: hypothetical protein A2Z88_00705 [Omnitrophica WOR_2 bacterium GWA2_47_8]